MQRLLFSWNLLVAAILFFLVQALNLIEAKYANSNPLVFMPQEGNDPLDEATAWKIFKADYSKQYSSNTEELFRFSIFISNLKYIDSHNRRYAMNQETYTLGVNEYADWSHEEFTKYLLSMSVDVSDDTKSALLNSSLEACSTFLPAENPGPLPAFVNWTAKGYVTPVKNQGQCGSCWAFSSTGSIEGQQFRKTKQLVSLSEQNLVDCSRRQGNMGCDGGLMNSAFKYVMLNHGIDTEASYPYTARDGTCHFNRRTIGATVSGFTCINKGSEASLQQAVATVGPVSVAIDASHMSFQFYKSGVYNELHCSSIRLDHAVLAVGYGALGGKAYWLVKNSWGTTWGQRGYIMMTRNQRNQCGIASMASYPLV